MEIKSALAASRCGFVGRQKLDEAPSETAESQQLAKMRLPIPGGRHYVMPAELGQPGAEPTVLHGHEDWVYSVAFAPDGQTLASGSGDPTIRLWILLDQLVEIGCAKKKRNLTWAEWQRYLPGEPYRQTCPALPPHRSVPEEALP